MKNVSLFTFAIYTVFFTLVFGISSLQAQPGPSFSVSYDVFPFSKLADPDPQPVNGQRNFTQDLEIRVATFSVNLSAPMVLSGGKTVLVNQLSYHRFDLDYNNWDNQQGGNRIENVQGAEYGFTLVRQLSRKWNLTAVVTPGFHSDFQDDLSYDDFNFQSAVIFGRRYSENFSLGFGFAYSLKFGQPLPLPFLTLQWTDGSSSRVDLLLPAYAEFWYLHGPKVEIGLAARVQGSRYHGSPARYLVENPQMRYSVGTAGPSVKLNLSGGLRVVVDGGVTFLRRFEFFDGDNEQASLNLRQRAFVKVGVQFGG